MNFNFEPEQRKEKKVRVRFLRDAVAERKDWLAGEIGEIAESDARQMAAAANASGIWAGRGPSVEILP